MWYIGDVPIKSRVVLAPMAGITSLCYREFCKSFGVGYSVTEMISDAGIAHHNKVTIDYLKTSKIDRPVALQLFGSKLDVTLKAIDIINNELKIDYDILDLNFGCPVPKVFNAGAGSAWLKNPNKLFSYVNEIVKQSTKPVTAKIRLGIDDEHINFLEIIDVLIKAGVKCIAVHARTSKQLYSGKADFKMLKNLGKNMKVPLVISGDIFSLDDAIKAMKITGAAGVMVARGGVGNPYLISQINAYYEEGIKLNDINIKDNIKYCRALAKSFVKEKGEKRGILIMRTIAPNFFNGLPNAKKIRCAIAQNIKTFKDLDLILKEIESRS